MTDRCGRRHLGRISKILAVLTVAAGCTSTTDAGPVTTAPPPTTTAASTTTTASTTTSSTTLPETTITADLPPWATLPVPEMPPVTLATEVGGPRPMDTLCLEIDLDGVSEGSVDWVLERLGIELVDEGCDLTLAIRAVGERSPAQYVDSAGSEYTCFNAYRLSGEITLIADGATLATWPIDRETEAPLQSLGCPAEDTPVSLETNSTLSPVVAALIDMFGPVAAMFSLARLQRPLADRDPRIDLLRSADGAPILGAALHDPDRAVSGVAAEVVAAWADDLLDAPYPQMLWDLIPHLIAFGAAQDFDDAWGGADAAKALIELMFRWPPNVMDNEIPGAPQGFHRDDPAVWWSLWEANPTP